MKDNSLGLHAQVDFICLESNMLRGVEQTSCLTIRLPKLIIA